MTSVREVRIDEFFIPTNGKPKYIRDFVDANSGDHPVYSASLSKPFGHIDGFDFDGHFLTWVMNGYGGRVQEVTGKFSANRDRGVLVPRPGVSVPSLTYLRFLLEPVFTDLAVGRRVDGRRNEYTKLYPPVVSEVRVELPITPGGDLDFPAMEVIGERLRRIEEIKSQTAQIEQELGSAELAFGVPAPAKTISLGDASMFRLSIGSRLLRKNVSEVTGVPIYSANVRRPFGYVEPDPNQVEVDTKDFDRPSLIWGIDGIFDWNLVPAGEPFVPTDHCGRAEVLSETLDPEYLLYFLRAHRSEHGFDRVFRANLTNLANEVTVEVPLDESGQPSLVAQRSLAASHRKLLELKTASLAALDDVLRARLGLQS